MKKIPFFFMAIFILGMGLALSGDSMSSKSNTSLEEETGRKLQLDNVVSGSKTQIKEKIWKQYKKSYPQCPLTRRGTIKKKLSDWYFYLKGDKVVISAGAYAPWGGNGETTVSLPGAY